MQQLVPRRCFIYIGVLSNIQLSTVRLVCDDYNVSLMLRSNVLYHGDDEVHSTPKARASNALKPKLTGLTQSQQNMGRLVEGESVQYQDLSWNCKRGQTYSVFCLSTSTNRFQCSIAGMVPPAGALRR